MLGLDGCLGRRHCAHSLLRLLGRFLELLLGLLSANITGSLNGSLNGYPGVDDSSHFVKLADTGSGRINRSACAGPWINANIIKLIKKRHKLELSCTRDSPTCTIALLTLCNASLAMMCTRREIAEWYAGCR